MSSNSEKKERSQAEFIVIIALIGVMMAIAVNFFIKNETQFARASFATMAQSFHTKVNAVHALWMMDRQPNIVYLASLNEVKKQAIPVNKAGWIDVKQKQLACEKIWRLVMEVPMDAIKFSVSAIEVRNAYNKHQTEQDITNKNQCRYVLLDGSYFQYNRAKGKVSKVMTLN
ncbi:MAG: hypothetical protein COB83_01260 [Gammaproteobacteria bacterium]|nr:MAG: hypothetical protein COB83_01260 [Gammaproteobacteria bacterium]